jgi:hypothetical protein
MYKGYSKFRQSMKTRNGIDIGLPDNQVKKSRYKKKKLGAPVRVPIAQDFTPPPIESFVDPTKPIKILKAAERIKKDK